MCKPCRAFASKSLEFDDDTVDGFFHSPLEGRRSVSFDNLHVLSTKTRKFSISTEDGDESGDEEDFSGNYNPLMTSGNYNTFQPNSMNSQNFTALKMMVSMFKPRTTTDSCNIDQYYGTDAYRVCIYLVLRTFFFLFSNNATKENTESNQITTDTIRMM